MINEPPYWFLCFLLLCVYIPITARVKHFSFLKSCLKSNGIQSHLEYNLTLRHGLWGSCYGLSVSLRIHVLEIWCLVWWCWEVRPLRGDQIFKTD